MATDAWAQMSESERRRINPFDYERAFPKVFKQGGFDAVIGNPPYVRMEAFVPSKQYLADRYESHEERADLYSYFLEKALRLIGPDGVVGEIVSNKFIRAKYGRPLRALIHKKAFVLEVADFAGANVFHGATVRTVVIFMKLKKGGGGPARYVPVPSPSMIDAFATSQASMLDYAAKSAVALASDALDPTEWRLTSSENSDLIGKLRSRHSSLSQLLGARALFGCKTGCNEAFIVGETERSLIDPDGQLLKPILFGKDIKRYGVSFAGRYVIYLHPDRNINDYPAVRSHLLPFRERLQGRAGPQQWWELQQPAVNLLRFENTPKIIYPIIANGCRFSLDRNGFLINDKAFILPSADLAILGVLNSRVADFYFSEVCAALEGENDRYLEFRAQYIDHFPVPAGLSDAQFPRLGQTVDSMLLLKGRLQAEPLPQRREQIQREIDATDRQIDQLVYQLYGLTDDEIRIVEEATG
jgi:hypothetical protein